MVVWLKKDIVKVAVGLVTDHRGRLLITQRAKEISHGGFWEFPGGKLEKHEAPEIALFRELHEEVNIQVLSYRYLGESHFEYDTYKVILYGYHVTAHQGLAVCSETQTDLQWVFSTELNNYSFPKANHELIKLFEQSQKRLYSK